MVAPGWTIGYFVYLAFVVLIQVAVCEQEHPEVQNNVFLDILGLATGTYCTMLWPQIQFILFLTITLPATLLLYSLLTPIFSGTTPGLIAGAVALLLLGTFFGSLVLL